MSKIYKVFIDPGHGGHDPGAVGNGMRESDVVLDISLQTGKLLTCAGIEVQYSRTSDIRPVGRAEMSNQFNADLFISPHANAGGGTGVETVVPTASPNNPNRDLHACRNLAESISRALAQKFNMRVRRGNGVLPETETAFVTSGRGKNISVLRNTRAIAVMPEIAFIDSPIANPDFYVLKNRRQEIAQVLANEVFKYFGITPQEVIKMIYKTVQDMPKWAQPGIQQLVDMHILNGRTPDNLDVDENMMRVLLIVRNMFDRAGLLETIAASTPQV